MQRVIFSRRWSGGYRKDDKTDAYFTIPNSCVGVIVEVPDAIAELAIADGAAKRTARKVGEDPGDGPAAAPDPIPITDKMERGGNREGRRAK